MSRLIGVSLAVGLGLLVAAGSASAQVAPPPYLYNRPMYGVGYRTPLSPYLNLANGGDPAVQYYLRTLPEFDRRATKQIYGAAIGSLEDQVLTPPEAVAPTDVELFRPLPTTGHPTAFGNTGLYFPAPGGRPPTQAPMLPPRGRSPSPR